MKYEIIQTGSDGNCSVIEGQIAIDMGVAWYKIEPYAKNLKMVLLTHQHGDHFKKRTVQKLAKERPTLKWVCGVWMYEHLIAAGVNSRSIYTIPMNAWYAFPLDGGEIRISAFETHHDVKNCGWRLWKSHHDSIFYATDCGDLEGIEAKAYSIYMVEANHTEAEIEKAVAEAEEEGKFSYRIRAAENHLSFEQARDWLAENMAPWSVWVLMHQHKEREASDGR